MIESLSAKKVNENNENFVFKNRWKAELETLQEMERFYVYSIVSSTTCWQGLYAM